MTDFTLPDLISAAASLSAEMDAAEKKASGVPRCGNCKWWHVDGPLMIEKSYRLCISAEIENLLWANGMNGLDEQDFYTGPDFGCVHWENKQS